VEIHPLAAHEGPACEAILRALPAWFGIEKAIQHYARAIEEMETFVARRDGQIIGFITLQRHFPRAAEIHVMAVHPEFHGQGIGHRLVSHAEARLVAAGIEFFQVKTLAPSHPDPNYAKTRRFYESVGFTPLEANEKIWGPQNPCLIMIRRLSKP
jgi:GNAT superfamily N-acetyltransferase